MRRRHEQDLGLVGGGELPTNYSNGYEWGHGVRRWRFRGGPLFLGRYLVQSGSIQFDLPQRLTFGEDWPDGQHETRGGAG